MTKDDVFELVSCFDRSTAQTMRVQMGAFSLELTRGGGVPSAAPQSAPQQSTLPQAAPAAPVGQEIKAPLVGTFYAASAPDQPPLVAVGDTVKKGQTVCLLEAMKMMSEVTSPCDGIITEICKANGQLAAFGEPLMRIRPC